MTNSNVAVAREMVPDNVQEAVIALESMNVPALRAKYRDVFKEDSRSHNGPYLRKRIGYRLQEMAYGGLSERAKARIRELVVDAPIRRRGFPVSKEVLVGKLAAAEPPAPGVASSTRDQRLPPAGTTLRRQYGKSVHVVTVED